MEEEYPIVNASFIHPFTCIVSGPSGCGKTTFVKELILNRDRLIDGELQYIIIYIGTSIDENPIFKHLQQTEPSLIKIIEIKRLYDNNKALFEQNFAKDFLEVVSEMGPHGCVIFDDMMIQLSRANLLSDLFSKISSHQKISVIHITQNLFLKGKQAQEHRTAFTSNHHLVQFKQPMDSSVFSILAKRVHSSAKYADVYQLLMQVADHYRYVIISGGLKRDLSIKYTSDIFSTQPVPFQRVFTPISANKQQQKQVQQQQQNAA